LTAATLAVPAPAAACPQVAAGGAASAMAAAARTIRAGCPASRREACRGPRRFIAGSPRDAGGAGLRWCRQRSRRLEGRRPTVAPVRADRPVEQDQLQRPGGGAFGQHRQVPRGRPAVPAPHEPVLGQRLPGQERADRGGQVLGPFQGQAGEPERLHERPDEQRVLPDAMYLAEQQQASGIQRPLGCRPRRGFDHQARAGDREFGHCPVQRIQRRHARHTSSMAPVLAPGLYLLRANSPASGEGGYAGVGPRPFDSSAVVRAGPDAR
jgi:hypothetical protein